MEPGISGSEAFFLKSSFENLAAGTALCKLPVVRLEPTNIQQIGDELAIAWNDGTESFLKLEMLRRACPCAACGGEPNVLGNLSRPHVSYSDKSFQLVGFDLVGGYALQPRWADGHNSGIYTFIYLRRLGEAAG